MILVPQTQEILHTGPTGMTVRHHANDRVPRDQPAIYAHTIAGTPCKMDKRLG
jgi:hypothetical protein